MDESKEHILQMLKEGTITAEEADRLLMAIEEPAPADDEPVQAEPIVEANLPHVQDYRGAWQVPFAGSLFALALSGNKIIGARGRKGFFTRMRLNMYWIVFALASLGAMFALWSRNARWLRVYVENEGNQIDISLPVPVHLLLWLLRTLRPYVDRETGQQLDMAVEFIQALQDEMDSPEGKPIIIDVHDEGSRVQVYFI